MYRRTESWRKLVGLVIFDMLGNGRDQVLLLRTHAWTVLLHECHGIANYLFDIVHLQRMIGDCAEILIQCSMVTCFIDQPLDVVEAIIAMLLVIFVADEFNEGGLQLLNSLPATNSSPRSIHFLIMNPKTHNSVKVRNTEGSMLLMLRIS